MQNINLNLLKYFYYVAKYNSYTKAAEILLISQPSISYSIKVLESQLNKTLFNRGKNLELTVYGKYLFKQVDDMMKIIESLSLEDEIKGKVIVGLRPFYTHQVFPYYFNQLCKVYPDLNIEYISGSSEKLKELLYTNQIDIMIDEYEYSGEYESFLQLEDDVIFFKDVKDKKVYDDETIKNGELCIVYPNRVTSVIKKEYPELNYLDFQSTPLMIQHIKSDQVLGVNPRSVLKEYLDNKEIKEVKSKITLPKAKMYITYNKKLKNKKTEAVVEFFREHSFYNLQKDTSN